MATKLVADMKQSLQRFNSTFNKSWDFGTNWSNIERQEFNTYINKYLFPKINETSLVDVPLGNRFNPIAKEVEFIGQFSEEYVILDSVPVNLDLSKSAELMLQRNYPKMATKLYNAGYVKKQKFTLNNNDVRLNFSTLGQATAYAVGVYKKKISDINVTEEREVKGALIDYALNQTKNVRKASSQTDMFDQVFEAILNVQNNSEKYNEANKASGGLLGRYTTTTTLDKLAILTNDKTKSFLLNTKIANTFQIKGLDLSDKIISFDDLGGTWRLTEDVQITEQATLERMQSFGDYQTKLNDILAKGEVITYDMSGMTEFEGKIEEIKPETDNFAFIFDEDKLKYRRNTKDMLKIPFYNPEFDEVTYWIHYYAFKGVSPFYNSVRIGG